MSNLMLPSLSQLYSRHKGKVSHKWSSYLTEYGRLFSELRARPVSLLEIGVQNGGSLELWAEYFSSANIILGCDNHPACASLRFDDPRIGIVIGDANESNTRAEISRRLPSPNVIIDDGSHLSSDIIKSFLNYFPLLADDGFFIAEDLHCSYWQDYEGGLFHPFSAVSFFKRLADILHHEHWGIEKTRTGLLEAFVDKFGVPADEALLASIHSVEFLNSITVVRKAAPDRNRLGTRIIAGEKEEVAGGHLDIRGGAPAPEMPPGQADNRWTAAGQPVEEEIQALLDEIAIGRQDIIRLNHAVLNLHAQTTEDSKRVTVLQKSVQELAVELGQMKPSKAWRLGLFLRDLRLRWIPPGGKRDRIAKAAYHLGINIRREGWKALRPRRKTTAAPPEVFSPATFDYPAWIRENEPPLADRMTQIGLGRQLSSRPLISILTPVFNTPEAILRDTINSVLHQTYENWELCLVDGNSAPGTKAVLAEFTRMDSRIRCIYLQENLGISANTNTALQHATGTYIHLLDHDDILPSFALYEIAQYLNRHPEAEMIYGDEDRMDLEGNRHSPFFKPDWSPDLLQAFMYVGHCTYRKDVVVSLGGLRSAFDFSQDYDLALRVSEVASHIGHIPAILYHWREAPGSAAAGGKDFARQTNIAALQEALCRRGFDAEARIFPTHNRAQFRVTGRPLVSIIIPSDSPDNIRASLTGLINHTRYEHIEILVVTRSDIAQAVLPEPDARIRMVPFDRPYNFSAKCNTGVEHAQGEFILFLNDDVFPQDADWLEALLGPMQQPEVGAISPMLMYPNGTIQHAGLVTGVRNLVGTPFHQWPHGTTQYFNLAQSSRTVSVLSAACLLMRRQVFSDIGGFDEANTPIMHSDLDLCFKIRERGLRLVFTPYTRLTHLGHVSLKAVDAAGVNHSPKVDAFMLKRWGGFITHDPYFPDNMRDILYLDSPVKIRMWACDTPERIDSHPDVLVQTQDFSLSGVPIIAFDQTLDMKQRGYFVTAIAAYPGGLEEKYKAERIPMLVDPLILESPDSIGKFIANYDAVLANTVLAWRLVLTAKSLGIPVLWVIQEGDFGAEFVRGNPEVQKALQLADQIVFSSRQTLAKYQEFLRGKNALSILFGVEPPNLLIESLPSSRAHRLRVIHVGSVEHRKGQDVLIEAVRRLTTEKRSRIDVTFVGRFLEGDFYQRQLKAAADCSNIRWLGSLPEVQVWKEIASADMLVCSSRDETGPLVVYQAMSLGKAVLSTPVGAVPEIIRDRENGILFPIGDAKTLSLLLAELIDKKPFMKSLGEEARKTYEEKLTKRLSNGMISELILRICKT